MTDEPEYLRINRAHWAERTAVHLGPRGYDLSRLRQGGHSLDAIAAAELPPLDGLRVVHLQCHIGDDTLSLLRLGAASVVGVDFSPEAVAAARSLAAELGLADRARFVESEVIAAPRAIPPPHGFDLVFTTWGTISWLPDIAAWAATIAALLRPGGQLYFADQHPAAWVFDDQAPTGAHGTPGAFVPYFHEGPLVYESAIDYADPEARLARATQHIFAHPLGQVVTALLRAGLSLEWLHEHAAVPWPMFRCLRRRADRLWRWPDQPWLPLGWSLLAVRRG